MRYSITSYPVYNIFNVYSVDKNTPHVEFAFDLLCFRSFLFCPEGYARCGCLTLSALQFNVTLRL